MKAIVTTILLIFISFFSYGINCPIVNYMENAEEASMIFIGKVDDIMEGKVTFQIHEIFKGNHGDKISVKVPLFFEEMKLDDFWLIYLYMADGDEFIIEECGGSKNFSNPIALSNIYTPQPPPLNLDEKLADLWGQNNQLVSLMDFQMELSYLGRKKMEWIESRELDNWSTDKSLKINLLIGLNLIVIILVVILLSKIRSKNSRILS